MAGEHIVIGTQENFTSEVEKCELPVLVDFMGTHCIPCKALEPILEELAEENQGRLKIVKVNLDDHPDIGARYGVLSLPTLLFFNNGEVVKQMNGAQPKKKLQKTIDKIF